MAESANKCNKCKKHPMVIASGTIMCPRCRVSATDLKSWNAFMEPVDVAALINKLERPIGVLKGAVVLSDDKGLIALFASTLKSINELDISDYVTDSEEAEKLQKQLEKIANG